jgi:NAD binding domain of 6-phosphogluconate dehydrogenase
MTGSDEPVAVLGPGAMGHGMAASALRAGIPVIVWGRRMEAAGDLAGHGAQVGAPEVVTGLFIWPRIDDQRQCSFVTGCRDRALAVRSMTTTGIRPTVARNYFHR